MKSLRENISEGLRHLAWSFIWKFLGAAATISGLATGAVREMNVVYSPAIAYRLPLSFYAVVALLIFCAITLFAILVLVLHNSVNMVVPLVEHEPLSPSSSKLVIRGAFYGDSKENEKSVLPHLKSLPKDAFAILVADNNMNVCANPATSIGTKRRLRVIYSYGNETVFETSRNDGEWLVLPDPTDRKIKLR